MAKKEETKKVSVRVVFRAHIYIDAESMAEARSKWEDMPLFSEEAEKCGAEFCDLEAVEDAETYDDLMDKWDEDDDEDEN